MMGGDVAEHPFQGGAVGRMDGFPGVNELHHNPRPQRLSLATVGFALRGDGEPLDLLVGEFDCELVENVAFPPVRQPPVRTNARVGNGPSLRQIGAGLRIFLRFARRSAFTRSRASSTTWCSFAVG